ncbi:MAG: phage terminase small subunit P27 family [Serratia proteamaculans]
MTGKSVTPGRGRKPKSTARKVLAGNPGKRQLNTDEPQFTPITHADPPAWFDDIGRGIWAAVIGELCSQQILYVTDLHNVVMFCSAYRNWQTAQTDIMTEGLTIMTPKGEVKKNPKLTVANEAMRQVVTFGSLLGLDPVSRHRLIGAAGKGKTDNPFVRLISS